MSQVDDEVKYREEQREKQRTEAAEKLKVRLNSMLLGERVQLGEYHFIQSLGKRGYIVVTTDKNDNQTSVCYIPPRRIL